MSELSIALVAEGPTDKIIIEAALKTIVGRPFVLTLLHPETSASFDGAGPLGGGWGGVYRWCRKFLSMPYPAGENPSLDGFDLVLLHVDADVAGMRYSDANIHDGRADLPCERPCPPAESSVNALRGVVAAWLDLSSVAALPEKWVFCNPSKCTEAWVVAALYRMTRPEIMTEIECNQGLVSWLSLMQIEERTLIRGGKKKPKAYVKISDKVTADWSAVCQHCTQAARFDHEVKTVVTGR
ncbi:MAG: hypothetical protein HQK58_03425 [Deltaproteobacteria bacterium]|nr:hypothetical protein [Deltaproteobacteria bacterium]